MGAPDRPHLSISVPSPSGRVLHGGPSNTPGSSNRPQSASRTRPANASTYPSHGGAPLSPTNRPQSAGRNGARSPHATCRSPTHFSRSKSARSLAVSPVLVSTADADSLDKEDILALLQAERRKVGMLESELRLALAANQQAEKAHQAELASMDADRKRLMAERRHLLSKLTDIETVEDSVKELYIQMKDRIAEDGVPTPEQLLAEKAALADENVLVVLGALHAQVKALWAFKVEAEADLIAGRAARDAQEESKLASMRAALRALEGEVRAAHQDTAAARMRAEMAEELTATVQAEATQVTSAMAAQHADLLKSLRAATNEAHIARRQATQALDEGKKRDHLVLTNRQLESARHFDRVAQDKELRRLQAAHEVQLSAMHRELHRISDLMATNAMQAEQLQQTMQANKQLRLNAQPGRVRELEQRVKALEAQLAASERKRANAEDTLLAAGAAGGGAANSPRGPWAPSDSTSVQGGSVRNAGFSCDGAASVVSRQSTMDSSRRNGGMSRSESMISRSLKLMAATRMASAKAAREKDQIQNDDPVYGVVANVALMHKETQAALKGVKRDLSEAGQTGTERGTKQGLGAGAYMALEKQATRNLESVRQPQRNKLGAAGTNVK